jgi:hypothetical protein
VTFYFELNLLSVNHRYDVQGTSSLQLTLYSAVIGKNVTNLIKFCNFLNFKFNFINEYLV